jgi:hypothetical protein
LLIINHKNNKLKDNEMSRSCSSHEKESVCSVLVGKLAGTMPLQKPGIDETMILKKV